VLSAGELRALGGNVDQALCVIDREEGGAQALLTAGIHLTPLFRRRDILEEAHD
jgi:orotate phosphoribosyltransferase